MCARLSSVSSRASINVRTKHSGFRMITEFCRLDRRVHLTQGEKYVSWSDILISGGLVGLSVFLKFSEARDGQTWDLS